MSRLNFSSMTSLSRSEMRMIKGGDETVLEFDTGDDLAARCLGCNNDQECKNVNKGDKCDKECPKKTYKGCNGW